MRTKTVHVLCWNGRGVIGIVTFFITLRPIDLVLTGFFDGDNLKFNKYPPQRKWLYISIAVEVFFPEFTHHVGHPIPWVIHLGLYVYFSAFRSFVWKETSCVANPSSWVQKSAPKCTSWEKWAAWCLKKCLQMKNFNTKRHQEYFKNWSSMSGVLRVWNYGM